MTWKPPLLPDHYAAGESQKSMIYSYLLFLWYVRLDRTGVILRKIRKSNNYIETFDLLSECQLFFSTRQFVKMAV